MLPPAESGKENLTKVSVPYYIFGRKLGELAKTEGFQIDRVVINREVTKYHTDGSVSVRTWPVWLEPADELTWRDNQAFLLRSEKYGWYVVAFRSGGGMVSYEGHQDISHSATVANIPPHISPTLLINTPSVLSRAVLTYCQTANWSSAVDVDYQSSSSSSARTVGRDEFFEKVLAAIAQS